VLVVEGSVSLIFRRVGSISARGTRYDIWPLHSLGCLHIKLLHPEIRSVPIRFAFAMLAVRNFRTAKHCDSETTCGNNRPCSLIPRPSGGVADPTGPLRLPYDTSLIKPSSIDLVLDGQLDRLVCQTQCMREEVPIQDGEADGSVPMNPLHTGTHSHLVARAVV
jgi:hypothetical protein